ncbi:MAG: hypothetical protein GXP21_07240 [Gammaproteobacteria bacterium]|nr:hypothetical protein [Gammaproteobacteria bacterium]
MEEFLRSNLVIIAVLTGLTGLFSLAMKVWQYWLSRKVKIRFDSNLVCTDEGGFLAHILVHSKSQRDIQVQAVRFDLKVWDQSPRLEVDGILKVHRVLGMLFDREGTWYFPSDSSLSDERNRLPYSLGDHHTMSVAIDLDEMMEEYFSYGEGGCFGNRLLFKFEMLFLTVVVNTQREKPFKFLVNREIRHYLYEKYKDDPRVLK